MKITRIIKREQKSKLSETLSENYLKNKKREYGKKNIITCLKKTKKDQKNIKKLS